MHNIYFLPAWGNSSSELLEVMMLQTPSEAGIWKEIRGTNSLFEADTFIMQDYTYDEVEAFLRINNLWHKVIYFSREVPGGGPIKKYNDVRAFSYLDKSSYLFTKWAYPDKHSGGVSTSYDALSAVAPNKVRSMICIQSNKQILEGHLLRLEFIEEFCRRSPSELDIAGGIAREKRFTKLNDPVEMINDDKFATCMNYKYCLAFDNGQYNNYFGTQFTDSLLSWCVPVYWGAPNIGDFFPEDSYISFDVRNKNEIERIVDIINDPEDYNRRLPAIEKARNLVLNKYNIWDTIREVITTGKSTW